MDFVHLHLHTTYSLLDGQCQIAPLVYKARKWNMPALAVTDHGNLFALKAFYDACRNAKKKFKDLPKIKPILGCETYVTSTGDYTSRDKNEYRHHLCLHAKNLVGYHNLVRLISEAQIHGVYYGHARIDHNLLEKYHEGLHCSAACIAGEVSQAIDRGDFAGAERIAKWYKDLFGDDYSLEVMLHKAVKSGEDVPIEARNEFADLYQRQLKVVKGMLELGKKLDIRVIATNDVHFLDREDDDSHDVLLALSTGKKMADRGRMIYTGQEYFKSDAEMRELFGEHPELLANTLAVAERIEEYELDSDPIMPKFDIPASFGTEATIAAKYDEATLEGMYPPGRMKKLGGYDKVVRIQFEAEYLASLVWDGAKKRWGDPLPKDIEERVAFELETIRTMGFPGYFLIVRDYIRAAREECDTWVGPGRGSAAGSAVAYALWITNVDPLKYDLLFERFLNPDRISMPDIDVDFDDAGRERVIDYVTNKYGADHVAHIITFGQMAAKSAIKDVGRVMDYPLGATNKLAGYVPDTPKIDFAKAMQATDKNGTPNKDYSPDLVAAVNSEDPVVHKLMERALRLEGSIRQPGVHACGILISRDPLIETLPVMPTPKSEGAKLLTTQYDGHFVEPVGLLKMDFLGLKTLTVEKECVALLGAHNPRVPQTLWNARGELDTDKIPDDDRETYELFSRGETTGLFQFESPGMKKWLIALQPERLTDLVAMNALYRPGPMDYIPTFVARKQGQEPIKYDHPLMEGRLKDTYGVTVYQEQVMLLSRDLAGFTRGESDKLRKAMGKKLMDIMAELKTKFIEGCLKNPDFTKETITDFHGYRLNAEKTDVVRDANAKPVAEIYPKLDLSVRDDALALIIKVWVDWEAFASYAFNKSHAVCYAWVAYQTGYLKAHYPAEFMCAQISSEIGNFDKLPGFVAEARDIGLKLLLPDVNESGARFVPTADARGIRYGLGGIKGVGSAAAEAIVAERRANGPYRGFLDFAMRLGGNNLVNKRVLENLVKSGAFSTLEPNRNKLFMHVEYALKMAQQRAKERNSVQASFFDIIDGPAAEVSDKELKDIDPLSPAEDLKGERDLLGVYISGDPLEACRPLIAQLSKLKVGDEVQAFDLSRIQRKPMKEEDAEGEGTETEEPTGGTADDDEDEKSVDDTSVEALLKRAPAVAWRLKAFARQSLRRKGQLPYDQYSNEYKKAISEEAKAIRKTVDRRLLKQLDVMAVAVLDGCTVKNGRPRPDGSVNRWAVLGLDDGRGRYEAPAFGRVWERCKDLETQVDSLVVVTGEIAYRTEYDKEDVERLHPKVGEVNFTLKEAETLATALPKLSDALRIKMEYTDPQIKPKVDEIRKAILANPGELPVFIELHYPVSEKHPKGRMLDVDLGPQFRVGVTLAFLSKLYKVVPASKISFRPDQRMTIAPPPPKEGRRG